MNRSHVDFSPRSFVHGHNLGAKMSAVHVAVTILLCDLSEFISMAVVCQYKDHIGYPKVVCSDSTYHISCSMVRHISLKVLSRVLANIPSAFRRILAFPPPKAVVTPMVSLFGVDLGKEEADFHSTWT